MIISRGRRYIFVHAPKTGGTSMALALEARAMADDILIGDTPKALKRRRRLKGVKSAGRLWKHSRLSDIDGLVSADEIASFFTFMLVRNPWDRMVSYYHWLRDQSFDHPAVALAKVNDFTGFVNHPQTQDAWRADSYGAYVTDIHGDERCDAFIRLENFAKDVAPLEAHLGFSLQDLPQSNSSRRPPDYRSSYSDADAELIAKLSAQDIARFSYQF
jgi:hypothetical protein